MSAKKCIQDFELDILLDIEETVDQATHQSSQVSIILYLLSLIKENLCINFGTCLVISKLFITCLFSNESQSERFGQ